MISVQEPDLSSYRSIAVVRMLRGLGDMLCVVPALRALRVALPKAHIALISLASARAFVTRFSHYVDELIESPGYPGIPEVEPSIREIPGFFEVMQARAFDLAIQMHGSGIVTNGFTALLGARHTAGFFLPRQFCPDKERYLTYSDNLPEIVRYVRLMEFLGIPSADHTLEFPLWKDDRETLARLPTFKELWPREYVCIHPGAHDPSRCWPAERFASVADALAALGMSVVLTGSDTEKALTGNVARSMKHKSIDLAGQTTLGALAVLLSNARLLICNDTGISHIAAALHVPSVIVFMNSDPLRWAPLDRDLHRPVPDFDRGHQKGGLYSATAKASGSDRTAYRGPKRLPPIEEVRTAAEGLLLKERFYWHEG